MSVSAPPDELARFMASVVVLPGGCWLWVGARSRGRGNRKWYGSFRRSGRDGRRGKLVRAHVYSHDVIGGKVCPPSWHRDHSCNISLCVNPECLEAVPPDVNQARKMDPYHGFAVGAAEGLVL